MNSKAYRDNWPLGPSQREKEMNCSSNHAKFNMSNSFTKEGHYIEFVCRECGKVINKLSIEDYEELFTKPFKPL